MTDTFPVQFGRYQLLERLAVGGMAELFKARVVGAHGFQKTVVIKKILPHLAGDPSFVNMFIDEAKITARLDHPKIAQVLELGLLADNLYIAMEYVEGVDALAILRSFAQRKLPIPAHLAVHICHEVLDALDYAHQARDDSGKPLGIVHRDISPSNVLVSKRGDVKLADFGIAHALDRQQRTQAGMLKGKYGYMSPEQVIGGDIDARSDLFSIGIILAEMLMGRRLFSAPNELDVLLMVRDVRLDRLSKYGQHIPAELMASLGRALQRDLRSRFQSAAEFREELAEWLFRNRHRVGPTDLAALVESIGPVPRPPPAPPPTPVPVDAQVQHVPRAISVGAPAIAQPISQSVTPVPHIPPTQPPRTPVNQPRPPRVGVGEGLVARVGDPLGKSQEAQPVAPTTGRAGVHSVDVPLVPPSVDPALDRTMEAPPVRTTPVGPSPLEPAVRTPTTPPPHVPRTPVGPSPFAPQRTPPASGSPPLNAPRTPVGPSPLTRSAELPAARTPVGPMPGHAPPPPLGATEQVRPTMPASISATPVPATRGNPRAPTPPLVRPPPPTSDNDIPIVVEDVGEVALDEPVVALRREDRKPPAASDSDVPILLESEQSQPVVTIERFPDAVLENDLQAELEAELSQVLGPVLDGGGVKPRPRRGEADFLDLSVELGLDMPGESAEGFKRPITGTRIPSVEALIPANRSAKAGEQPDEIGDLSATSPIRILYRLAVDKASGLLVVEVPSREGAGVVKEIFFALGNPEYVTSNLARELFGEYLVSQRVISPGELAMALAMMPHFGGRLGDTLVGLGLLKPLDVFRHLTRQVRDKIVDVCTWQKGTYRWYRGKRVSRDSFPLGLDAFEVLGAGATALPGDLVEAWAEPSFDRLPVAAKNGRVVPEAFRLGTYPRDVYNRLDGRNSLRQLLGRFTSTDDRLAFLRTLYLLNQTELAYWV